MILFFLGLLVQSGWAQLMCSELDCHECFEQSECAWCADDSPRKGGCQAAQDSCRVDTEPNAYDACPQLERSQVELLKKVFDQLQSSTSNPAWNRYLNNLLDDVSAYKCPRNPDIGDGFTCIDGKLETFRLQASSLARSGASRGQVEGSLPSELSMLSALKDIYVQELQLTGQFPDLHRLTRLEYLLINNNNFTGEFPSISQLTNLRQVWAQDNQFSGRLPRLPPAAELETVQLSRNRFDSHLPAFPAELTSLVSFGADGNRLYGDFDDSLQLPPNIVYCKLSDKSEDEDACFQTSACPPLCRCTAASLDCTLRESEKEAFRRLRETIANETSAENAAKLPAEACVESHERVACEEGRLSKLLLHDMALQSLPSLRVFSGLEQLDLSFNQLKTLPVGLAHSLTSLKLQANALNGSVSELLRGVPQLTECVLGVDASDESNCFDEPLCPKQCECTDDVLGCGLVRANPTQKPVTGTEKKVSGATRTAFIVLAIVAAILLFASVLAVVWKRKKNAFETA